MKYSMAFPERGFNKEYIIVIVRSSPKRATQHTLFFQLDFLFAGKYITLFVCSS